MSCISISIVLHINQLRKKYVSLHDILKQILHHLIITYIKLVSIITYVFLYISYFLYLYACYLNVLTLYALEKALYLYRNNMTYGSVKSWRSAKNLPHSYIFFVEEWMTSYFYMNEWMNDRLSLFKYVNVQEGATL